MAETVTPQPKKEVLAASIRACIMNGERILDDATMLEFQEPPCTRLMLSMIAQEEFSKAFLLFLVLEDVIPWSVQLLRAMNDHACKQLVGVVIEYVDPEWETTEQLEKIAAEDLELGDRLPFGVASAIDILRHEKIRRWESNDWQWAEHPNYEPSVLRIAKGKRDRFKQDALYVRLGRHGGVANMPTKVTRASADEECAKANQYRWFVNSVVRAGKR